MNRSREDWRARDDDRRWARGSDTPHHRSHDERLEGPRSYRGEDRPDWREGAAEHLNEFFDDDALEARRAERQRRMEAIRQSMRGRGPRPVLHDDEHVRDKICRRMSDDEDLDASDIHISVRDGEVTLTGVVDDEDECEHAQRCAESVRGVRRVRNRLRTRDDDWRGEDERRHRDDYGRRSFGNLFERDAGAMHGYDLEGRERRRARRH